jgi:hypothetical protein
LPAADGADDGGEGREAAAYLSFERYRTNNKANTLAFKKSVLRSMFLQMGQEDPTQGYRMGSALAGFRRLDDETGTLSGAKMQLVALLDDDQAVVACAYILIRRATRWRTGVGGADGGFLLFAAGERHGSADGHGVRGEIHPPAHTKGDLDHNFELNGREFSVI